MGRVSEHLKKFHGNAAETHSELSKCYGKLAGMGKAVKGDLKDGQGEGFEDCLQKIADTHAAAAEYHNSAMAECSKAIESADLEKSPMEPLPAGLSRVAPERTSTIRAVPRTGAPAMPIEKAHAGHIGGIDFLGLKELEEI
jgi:hypothetical protein